MICSSRRRQKKLTDITLTPLIDVALTLVVALIIAMPSCRNAIKIALPKSAINEQDANKAQAILHIDNLNNLYINENLIGIESLGFEISKHLDQDAGVVFIKADQAVNYGFLVQIIEAVKLVKGVKNVALLTGKG